MSSEFTVYRVYKDDKTVQGKLETASLDDLPAGEVTIKAEYSSVNYKDALGATGAGKILQHFPIIAGIDVAGQVHSSEDARFKPGDPVLVTGFDFGVDHDGGYAEYCRVPAEWVIPVPESMTTYEAMSIGTAGFTVALCIHRLEQNGQTPDKGPIIVTGATGGVGMFAVDMLSRLGYDVVALTGKMDRKDELMALGASDVIDRRSLDLNGPPLEKGQWGGAIDNVGGDILAWLTRTVRPWGNIASVGLAGGAKLNTTVMPFILRGVSLLGITSANCPTDLRHQLWQRLASDLKPQHLERIVSGTASLSDLPAIFSAMLNAETTGRTVIKISSED